jgi:hypothetical protein
MQADGTRCVLHSAFDSLLSETPCQVKRLMRGRRACAGLDRGGFNIMLAECTHNPPPPPRFAVGIPPTRAMTASDPKRRR